MHKYTSPYIKGEKIAKKKTGQKYTKHIHVHIYCRIKCQHCPSLQKLKHTLQDGQ